MINTRRPPFSFLLGALLLAAALLILYLLDRPLSAAQEMTFP